MWIRQFIKIVSTLLVVFCVAFWTLSLFEYKRVYTVYPQVHWKSFNVTSKLDTSNQMGKKVFNNFSKPGEPDWCRKQKFRSPPGKVTGLIFQPGSGNTWLRYLIQQLSGVKTGSIYRDNRLKKSGFAENVKSGTVAVVKSHKPASRIDRRQYRKVILLVRDLMNASIAEFNRIKSEDHTGFADI